MATTVTTATTRVAPRKGAYDRTGADARSRLMEEPIGVAGQTIRWGEHAGPTGPATGGSAGVRSRDSSCRQAGRTGPEQGGRPGVGGADRRPVTGA